MTFRELNKLLLSNVGIIIIRTAHTIYIDIMKKSGSIPVPNHKGDIPKGTLNNILKQAGLK